MRQSPARLHILAARPPRLTPLRLFGLMLDRLFEVIERYRQRRALRAMPEYLLKDIGLSRADAEREGAKPFWTP